MKKILLIAALFIATLAESQVKISALPSFVGNMTGVNALVQIGNANYKVDLGLFHLKSDSSKYATKHYVDSVIASIPSLANYYTKTQSDARYLQSFSETDPKRIVSVVVTGTSTKTVTITLADATTVTTTFTDQQGSGGGVSGNADSLGSHPASYYATTAALATTNSNVSAKANQQALVDTAAALRLLLGWSVKTFGAAGDTVTDNTAFFQAALNARLAAGGGMVYVPPGAYKIGGNLTIPVGVFLRGTFEAPTSHTQNYSAYWGTGYDLLISGGVPSGGGSILLITGGSGNANGTPTFTLATNSGIEGFCFYYPNQVGPSSSTPTAYPFAIKATGNNITVRNNEFLNAYQAVYYESVHRGLIRGNTGQPLRVGIYCAGGGDVNRVEDNHFGAWVSYAQAGTNYQLGAYVNDSCEAFKVGREDNIIFSNNFAYGTGYLFHFISTPSLGGGAISADPWAEINNCGGDANRINFGVDAGQLRGILVHGGQYINVKGGPSVIVASSFAGRLKFDNSYFYNSAAKYATVAGSGMVSFNNCIFTGADNTFEVSTSSNTGIVATGTGQVSIQGCTYNVTQPQASFASTVTRAAFMNNIVAGAVSVNNSVAAGFIIANNVESTSATGSVGSSFPLGTETIYDNFNGSAGNLTGHTADAGGAYSKKWSTTGNISLSGSGTAQYTGGAAADVSYGLATTLGSADQTATLQLNLTGTAGTQTDDILGIMLRSDPSASGKTGYEGRLENSATGIRLQLVAWVNGAATVLYNNTTTAFTTTTSNKITVTAVGSTITLLLNGTSVYSTTDTSVTGSSTQRSVMLTAYSTTGTTILTAEALAAN